MISLISKRFSLLHMLMFSIGAFVAAFTLTSFWNNKASTSQVPVSTSSCEYNIKRMTGLKFVKPILWVDENCESDNLAGTKQKVTEIIERYKQYEGVNSASVLIRSSGKWTVINENEKYQPGSLFKVPVLIAILKMDEDNPGFLNKKVVYDKPIDAGKKVNFTSKTIKLGQSYTIKELLTYMIKYSDNEATILVEQNMDNKVLQKLFADIGVEVPNAYDSQYQFTVKDYSLFMRTIFNAGYLTIKNSEYAAELLAKCEFKEGIAKGLPANIKMAHKFGESGNQIEKQLHETAVVFLDNKGYLITVMTKGNDMKKLSNLIGDISRVVYQDISNESE
ncbi:MAG: serine hydrolase [Flavobacterium sp.]|uniref:serine hydrolase n=1 Tax=Flavobacterium sp. TaxID=239 RepID=UPI003266D193